MHMVEPLMDTFLHQVKSLFKFLVAHIAFPWVVTLNDAHSVGQTVGHHPLAETAGAGLTAMVSSARGDTTISGAFLSTVPLPA
jgi:hypothetical protein